MRESDPAAALLDVDELDGLIPSHLSSRADLNQWEAVNIANAIRWVSSRRRRDVLNVKFLRDLHRRMFDQTWKWAGTFRKSDKNISPFAWHQVPALLHELVENTRVRHAACAGRAGELDELAARFHHELVRIHPWPNGNGRHSRMASDLLLMQWGRPAFTWGSGADLDAVSVAREAYIAALRSADAGTVERLVQFCRA